METMTQTTVPGKGVFWTGWILSGLLALFMLFDGAMKLVQPAPVIKASAQLGFSGGLLFGLGVVLTIATILYVIPLTAVLGAIILTGYLGGAVACQLRIGAAPFPVAFPVIFGVLIWLGLLLRDERLQGLLPVRRKSIWQPV